MNALKYLRDSLAEIHTWCRHVPRVEREKRERELASLIRERFPASERLFAKRFLSVKPSSSPPPVPPPSSPPLEALSRLCVASLRCSAATSKRTYTKPGGFSPSRFPGRQISEDADVYENRFSWANPWLDTYGSGPFN